MSEGLAEVMLLSLGYMSTERPVIAWISRLRKSAKAHFQIGTVFINKPQIWVLNNYILAWNIFKTTWHNNSNVWKKYMWIYGGWNTMLRELNQSACSAPKSHRWKFQTFEKVLPREQGLSEGQICTQNFI